MVWFLAGFAVLVAWIVFKTRQAGSPQVSDAALASARPLARISRDSPGPGWQKLGSRTTTRGLDIRFDADDDPEAEATHILESAPSRTGAMFAPRHPVRLTGDWSEHHVHTRGYVARIRLRGTGQAVGRQVMFMMKVAGNGEPWGVTLENDDDREPAMGDWIEVESVEVLKLRESP